MAQPEKISTKTEEIYIINSLRDDNNSPIEVQLGQQVMIPRHNKSNLQFWTSKQEICPSTKGIVVPRTYKIGGNEVNETVVVECVEKCGFECQ